MESAQPRFDGLLQCVTQLPNGELTQRLRQLNEQKCVRDAELLLYLSELDKRGLYRKEAVSSLFDFCVSRLGCSEDVAWKRVGAARLMRQFPLVFDLLCTGRIHLSALMLIKPHLTEENHREWLLAASGKSKRQVEKLVACRCPKPDAATSIRKLPESRPLRGGPITNHASATRTAASTAPPIAETAPPIAETAPPIAEGAPPSVTLPSRAEGAPPSGTLPSRAEGAPPSVTLPSRAVTAPSIAETAPSIAETAPSIAETAPSIAETAPPIAETAPPIAETAPPIAEGAPPSVTLSEVAPHRAVGSTALPTARIAPLSARSYRVTFTASERWKRKLERARELASHVISPSDLPALLERALDLLIEREERRRCAFGVKSRANAKHHQTTERHADAAPQAPARQVDERQADPERQAAARNAAERNAAERHAATQRKAETERQADERHAATQRKAEPERQAEDRHTAAKRQADPACQVDAKRIADDKQQPCQMRDIGNVTAQDPGRAAKSYSGDRNLRDATNGPLQPAKTRSRYVPAAVRREIWERDEGRCTFTDAQGNRCEERCFLDIEHLQPFALNGETSVSNCTLRCRSHNMLAAEMSFGSRQIASAIARAREH